MMINEFLKTDEPPSLEKKVKQAIRLLQSIPHEKEIELCYSGGKDSDVILELAKMAGIPVRPIYKCTTIDPKGTTAHCKSKGVEVVMPEVSFFKLIERKGFPTFRARFCCDKLKEYKICDVAIQGIRRSESTKRAANYKEPQICRFYGSKKNHVSVFLPILEERYTLNRKYLGRSEDLKIFIEKRQYHCDMLGMKFSVIEDDFPDCQYGFVELLQNGKTVEAALLKRGDLGMVIWAGFGNITV